MGLEEYLDMPAAAREDPLFIRTDGKELGRDGCRVPLPWTTDPSTSFGFSPTSAAAEPWLPQPADWGEHSVEREAADPQSMLAFYRTLLAHRPLLSGDLKWVDLDLPECLAFERDGALVVTNVGGDAVELPAGLVAGRTVILATQPEATATHVPSDTCVWLSPAH
jgi:alpha-glucosidase